MNETDTIGSVIARVACPDCSKVHAVRLPGSTDSCLIVECAGCARRWSPGSIDVDEFAPAQCHDHPGRPARWVCGSCEAGLCDPCSRKTAVHGHETRLSPCCREACLQVAVARAVKPFWHDVPLLLSYPLRPSALILLVLFFVGGFVPILSWLMPFFVAAYSVHVLRSSSNDPERPPDFPDFDSVIEDVLYPLLRLIGASLIAWAPLLLYLRFTGGERSRGVVVVLAIAGIVYYPLVVVVAAVCRSLRPVVEVGLLTQILRSIRVDYAVAVVFLGALGLVGWGVAYLSSRSAASALLGRFAHLYLLVLGFHVLGRLVYQTRDRVDWEV